MTKQTYIYSYGETLSNQELAKKRLPFAAIPAYKALNTLKEVMHDETLHLASIENTEVRMDSGIPNVLGGTVPNSRRPYSISKGSVDVFQPGNLILVKFVWPGSGEGVDYRGMRGMFCGSTYYHDEILQRTKLFPQLVIETLAQESEIVRNWQDKARSTIAQDALGSIDFYLAKEFEWMEAIRERARDIMRTDYKSDDSKAEAAKYLGNHEETRKLVRDAYIRPILAKGKEYDLQEVVQKAEEVLAK